MVCPSAISKLKSPVAFFTGSAIFRDQQPGRLNRISVLAGCVGDRTRNHPHLFELAAATVTPPSS